MFIINKKNIQLHGHIQKNNGSLKMCPDSVYTPGFVERSGILPIASHNPHVTGQ